MVALVVLHDCASVFENGQVYLRLVDLDEDVDDEKCSPIKPKKRT